MMSVDESLMCSFQILKPSENKERSDFGNVSRLGTPPRKFKHVLMPIEMKLISNGISSLQHPNFFSETLCKQHSLIIDQSLSSYHL